MAPPRNNLSSSGRRTDFVLAGGLLLLAGATACASSGPPTASGPVAAEDAGELGLRAGDALLLRVWREPELSDTVRVDQYGRVVLPLLGERQVAGITTDSLERQLERDFREYLKNPAIDITALRRVSILGAVTRPGLYTVDATISLSDALALAGGVSSDGDESGIRLIRDGTVLRESLDRSALMARLPIRSGDQVYVRERSWLSRNWQWLAGPATTIIVVGILR